MGSLYGDLDKLLTSIKRSAGDLGINLDTNLQREILKLYFEKYLISPFKTPELAIKYIEKFPRKVSYEPRPMKRYTQAEMDARRAQSEKVRDTMLSFLLNANDASKSYNERGGRYDRGVYRYFYSPMPGEVLTKEQEDRYKQYNEEVAFLFNLNENWQQYAAGQAELFAANAEQRNAFLTKYHLPQDTDLTADVILDTFARRRSEITMQLFREHAELMSHVDELTSQKLSPQELASNFWKLQKAGQFFVEFGKSVTEPMLPLKFTPEELQEIGDSTRFQSQSSHATNRFYMIANPLYEFIDIDAFDDYSFSSSHEGGAQQFDLDSEKEFDEDAYEEGDPLPNDVIFEKERDIAQELQNRYPEVFTEEVLTNFFNPLEHNSDGSLIKDAKGNPVRKDGLAPHMMYSAFDNLVSDYMFYFTNSNAGIKNALDNQLNHFGLAELHQYRTNNVKDPKRIATETRCYVEETGNDEFSLYSGPEVLIEEKLFQGSPVAFSLNGRTLIVSMARDNVKDAQDYPEQAQNGKYRRFDPSCLTYENCEILYNSSLVKQAETMMNRLNASDSMFVRSSDAFKEMKECMRQVTTLSPLQTGESTVDSMAHFKKLLYAAEGYLTYKKDDKMLGGINSTSDEDRSSYELERVKTARSIRTFAQAKIKELELTDQARETLRKFTRIDENGNRILLDEAVRNELIRTADKEAEAAAIFRLQRADNLEHQQNPVGWISEQIKQKYTPADIGEDLSQKLSDNEKALRKMFEKSDFTDEAAEDYDPYYKNFYHYADTIQDLIAVTVGEMIAAEMIRAERRLSNDSAVPGALEAFFETNNDVIDLEDDMDVNSMHSYEAIKELGMNAMKQIAGRDFTIDKSFSQRDMKDILESFQPEMLAETMRDAFCKRWGLAPLSSKLFNDYVLPLRNQKEGDIQQPADNAADYSRALQEFATDNIVKPFAKNYSLGHEKISKETCRQVLASAILYRALQDEQGNRKQGAEGGLSNLFLKNPKVIEHIRKNLEQSDAVNQMMAALPANAVASGQVLADMLAQIRQPDFAAEIPEMDAAFCRKQLGEELYKRILAFEIDNPVKVDNADAVIPQTLLKDMYQSSREDVLTVLADAKVIHSLIDESSVKGKVSVQTMNDLMNKVTNPAFLPDMPFLNQNMCCELLGEAILTSVMKMQASKEDASLQKMYEEKPANYRAVRQQIVSTPELRSLVSSAEIANNGLSMRVITQLCSQAKDVPFCINIFQKAIENLSNKSVTMPDDKQLENQNIINGNPPQVQNNSVPQAGGMGMGGN